MMTASTGVGSTGKLAAADADVSDMVDGIPGFGTKRAQIVAEPAPICGVSQIGQDGTGRHRCGGRAVGRGFRPTGREPYSIPMAPRLYTASRRAARAGECFNAETLLRQIGTNRGWSIAIFRVARRCRRFR